MGAKTLEGTLLGYTFQTDNVELYTSLALDDDRELNRRFPTFRIEVVNALKLMGSKRLRSERITYFNYRLQVWAESKFDADPTPPIRIIPVGELVDPDGPVTFEASV